MKFKIKKIYIFYTILIVLVFVSVLYFLLSNERYRKLEIYFFDLRGGYAVFIRTPDDKRVLINCGPNSEIIRRITKILPFYSRRIDYVFLTDQQDRNITGAVDVFRRYVVKNLFLPLISLYSLNISTTTNQVFVSLKKELSSKKAFIHNLVSGDSVDVDGVNIDVLFPAHDGDFKYSKASAPELVLKINYINNSFLLLGNVSKKIQKYLIASSTKSDILFIPHSISDSNTSNEFLSSINPKNIIYSQNKGGVLNNGFNIRQTGMIKVVSDGNHFDISETE